MDDNFSEIFDAQLRNYAYNSLRSSLETSQEIYCSSHSTECKNSATELTKNEIITGAEKTKDKIKKRELERELGYLNALIKFQSDYGEKFAISFVSKEAMKILREKGYRVTDVELRNPWECLYKISW
jgi:hypothetical protein